MKSVRITTIIILLILALNALLAGYSMITDPSGSGLKMSVSLLEHSPFCNFLIPGIVLFMVNGVYALVTAIFTIFERRNFQALIVWQGIILVVWIFIQVIMLQTIHILHGILFIIGFLIFALGNRLNV